MVKPSPWENDMLDTMWAFMQMGGLKADYPALKEACMELRQMMMQKTAEGQAERPVLGQSGTRQGDDHLRGYGPGSLRRVRGGRSMIEFIFFKIVVPVAAAVICGLLVWFVIDCLEASSWAEEDVKMPGFHVSAGIGGIYAGITNSKGEWKDRDRVTTEAVEAVRDYFLAIRETDGVDSMEYKWVTGDGSEVTLTLRKTAPENGGSNAE